MEKGTEAHVSLHVDAPPEKLYELVSDVTRMGEWSPECRRCEWIDGATGPAVGARCRSGC
ncbi:MAG: SRPBCC family protein [Acidimicrobiia bacterium]